MRLLCLVLLACFIAYGDGKDPYKILGVSKYSSADEVKRAYKALARKYHPDKAGDKSQQKFIEVQQAYETLSDPAKKREYDLGGSSSSYSRSGGGYGRSQYSSFYSGWGDAYSGSGQQKRTFYDTSFDDLLPSETTLLTSLNMRQLIFYGNTPWLIQLYVEDSAACKHFAPVWEGLRKAMASSAPDKPWVSMGRVNWRHQRNLAAWLANTYFTGGSVAPSQLPLIYGVPRSCKDPRCFVRYPNGALTLLALQDFAAAKLLKLPPVLSVSSGSMLDVLLQHAHPAKVIALAFSKSEGQGTIALRQLALKQQNMIVFARVAVGGVPKNLKGAKRGSSQEQHEQHDAAAAALEEWSTRLGVKVTVPSLVLLRGPGAPPEVLTMKPGEAHGYEEIIDAKGLMWQVVPALRPFTIEHLGCKWWDGRRPSVYSRKSDPSRICLVVVGRGRNEMARRNALQLIRLLAQLSTEESKRKDTAAAAAALMAGQLHVVWLDANVQRAFCVHHMRENGGTESESDTVRSVCGSGGWGAAFIRAGQSLIAQDLSAALHALLTLEPHPQTAMVAYVPTPTPSTRGRDAPVHHFSTYTEFPSMGDRPLNNEELMKIAIWASRCLEQEEGRRRRGWKDWLTGQEHEVQGPLEAMQSAGGKLRYPPPLEEDDIQNSLEFLQDRFRQLWGHICDLFGTGLALVGPEFQQVLGLFFTVGVILLLHQFTGRVQPPEGGGRGD